MVRMLPVEVSRTLPVVLSPQNVSRRDRLRRQPEASDLPACVYNPMHSCEHSFLWVAGLSHPSKAAQPRTLLCVSNSTHVCWWAEPSPTNVSQEKPSTQPLANRIMPVGAASSASHLSKGASFAAFAGLSRQSPSPGLSRIGWCVVPVQTRGSSTNCIKV